MTNEQLQETLRLHGLWLRETEGGVFADLRGADLRDAKLGGERCAAIEAAEAAAP